MNSTELISPIAETEQIVASVFQTMLGLHIEPVIEAVEAAYPPHPDALTAVVHLAGSWSGAVILETSRLQACVFTARFLSIKTPESVDNDVLDVLGELANMIGGNLKCTLAPGATLSMPSVIEGTDYRLRICSGEIAERRTFSCAAGVFCVSRISLK